MPVRITCPACKTPFVIAEEQRGTSVRCDNCQKMLAIPAASGKAAPTGISRTSSERSSDAITERRGKPLTPAPRRRDADADRPTRRRLREDSDDRPRRKQKSGPSLLVLGLLGGGVALLLLASCGGGLFYFLRSAPVTEPIIAEAFPPAPAFPVQLIQEQPAPAPVPVPAPVPPVKIVEEPKVPQEVRPSPGPAPEPVAEGPLIRNHLGNLGPNSPNDTTGLGQCKCEIVPWAPEAGKRYIIDMKALPGSGIDPLLRLVGPNGQELARDDDSGGFLNARIITAPMAAGKYQIVCTTFQPGTLGAFVLTVTELGVGVPVPGPPPPLPFLPPGPPVAGGKVIANHNLRLTPKSKNDDVKNGSKAHVFVQVFQQGKKYVIDMKHPPTAMLDPFLRLLSPQGQQIAFDDDSGGALDARIVFTAPSTGIYRIVATTNFPNQIGPFQLIVTEVADGPAAPAPGLK